jgi:hypothetical protein
MALVAFLFAIAAGAFYMLVLTPEHHKATALNAKIATQQQALATAQQQLASGRAAQAKLRAAQAQLASVNVAVPAHSDMPEVLRALERAAKAAHVQMQSITVSASTSATSQPSASSTPPSASGTGTANATPIQLTFAGGYLALEKLVRRLDGFVVVSGNRVNATGPLLSVSSVQLSGAPKLTANLSANIYQRSAASAPSTATATTTAPTTTAPTTTTPTSTTPPTAAASMAPRTAG